MVRVQDFISLLPEEIPQHYIDMVNRLNMEGHSADFFTELLRHTFSIANTLEGMDRYELILFGVCGETGRVICNSTLSDETTKVVLEAQLQRFRMMEGGNDNEKPV